MTENNGIQQSTKSEYREMVSKMGKKEFTLLKMQEYGFWPKGLPTPYERQKNETEEDYAKKQALTKEYENIVNQITKLYEEKSEISEKLRQLRKKYDNTWNEEKIRRDIAKQIMEESIKRRSEKKEQKRLEKKQRTEAWEQKKSDEIVFIGKGYSGGLSDKETCEEKLALRGLPLIKTDKELSDFLGIEYKTLRFLVYHRDVVEQDHYHRYTVPKRKGGTRNIAAPKPELKACQRKILEEILNKIPVAKEAHGFIKDKSIVSGAVSHATQPDIVINMDLEDFFPTITFERVRGLFKSFGYSGYISSLFAMLCTYCERMPIEVRGRMKYVKTSERILPQGSPASPMITNILCIGLDRRLNGLAEKYGFVYTRYADDMSFSSCKEHLEEGKFCNMATEIIRQEGFKVNKAKTKFLRKNNRQVVTGILVNSEEIGVPKKWVKKLRAAIHNANKLKKEGELPQKVIHEISGMAAWLKGVNPKRYEKIIAAALEVIK